jgi:hypothetical protein
MLDRRVWASLAFMLAAGASSACVGDDPVSASGAGTDGGGTTVDGGGGGTDGGATDDASGGCTPADSVCNGTVLHHCRANGTFEDTSCDLGCADTPTPHCKTLVPSANGVVAADLDGTGLGTVAIVVSTTMNSDTGEIAGLRTANVDPTAREVISGIAFHTAAIPGAAGAKIGIFSFADLTIGDGKIVSVQGTNAVALTSAKDITDLGLLDVRGPCTAGTAGPGGGKGGTVAGLAAGQGKGTAGASNASDATSGGGGGGFGDNGGNTTQLGVGGTTAGGAPYGVPSLVPLLGGSGGGRGGDTNAASQTTGGNGGGGGGAIQLVAVSQILIGGGSTVGGINAGGCGGAGAATVANGAGAGGGGGSGGAILLEAGTVKIDVFGALVANGGSGGGGAAGANATAGSGKPGALTWDQTTAASLYYGSAVSSSCGNGGEGGSSAATPAVTKGKNGALGGTGGCTGGAGGSAGRIRLNSIAGAATLVGSAYTSPRLADMSSHAEVLATQGSVTIQ